MGHEPQSTLLARQLLSICLPSRSGIYAVGSISNILYLSTIDGELIWDVHVTKLIPNSERWSILRRERQHQQAVS